MEPGHLLHSTLTFPPCGNTWRLKLRHQFFPAAQQLIIVCLMTAPDVRRSGWITYGMRSGWTTLRDSTLSTLTPARTLLQRTFRKQCGFGLTASASESDVSALACTHVVLPSLRSVSVTQKNKSFEHVVLECSIHRTPHGLHGLTFLDDETIE